MYWKESGYYYLLRITVWIRTGGNYYKFCLEALLETMKSLSPSVTGIVEDRGGWAKKALTDEISAAFKAEGWNMDCVWGAHLIFH